MRIEFEKLKATIAVKKNSIKFEMRGLTKIDSREAIGFMVITVNFLK